jgi:ArsR family transcriptional regulator, nickel/cobalt-responsive transcriptional repressor
MAESLQPERCARLLKALAEPERLRIIDCLRHGPRNVSELSRELSSDIVNVSHHLRVLREVGLVLDQKQGRFVVYQLHPEVFEARGRAGNDHLDLGCCRLEMPRTHAERVPKE